MQSRRGMQRNEIKIHQQIMSFDEKPRSFTKHQGTYTKYQEASMEYQEALRNGTKTLWNSIEVYEMSTNKLAWNAIKTLSGIQNKNRGYP